jgi:hypothetical protein
MDETLWQGSLPLSLATNRIDGADVPVMAGPMAPTSRLLDAVRRGARAPAVAAASSAPPTLPHNLQQ